MGKASRQCLTIAIESITSRVRALRENVEAVRREEPEGIHDMRVASRRLRAALSEYAAVFPGRPRKELLRQARRITRLLGRPRELDVTLDLLAHFGAAQEDHACAAADTIKSCLREERARLSPDCLEAAHIAASEELDGILVRLFDGVRPQARRMLNTVARRLKRRFDALNREYATWTATDEREQLHRVRIAFKKFRYACELFSPFFDEDFQTLIQEMRQIQEHLGAWNDGRILLREVAIACGPDPETRLAGMAACCAAVHEQMRRHLEAFHAAATIFFSPQHRRSVRRIMRAARLPQAD